MAKNYVLAALRLLGLEEMLKLSQVLRVKQNSMKKAAGEDLVVWDQAEEFSEKAPSPSRPEGKLLKFNPPQTSEQIEAKSEDVVQDLNKDAEPSLIVPSEFMLWQRELTKEATPPKQDAVKGYSRSSEMYVVKSSEKEGTGKIRFAAIQGVLVNKKQG